MRMIMNNESNITNERILFNRPTNRARQAYPRAPMQFLLRFRVYRAYNQGL